MFYHTSASDACNKLTNGLLAALAGIDLGHDHEINYNEFLAATMHRNTFIKEEYIRLAYNTLGESQPQTQTQTQTQAGGEQSLSLRDSLPPCFFFCVDVEEEGGGGGGGASLPFGVQY